jgi:hypothetical protein
MRAQGGQSQAPTSPEPGAKGWANSRAGQSQASRSTSPEPEAERWATSWAGQSQASRSTGERDHAGVVRSGYSRAAGEYVIATRHATEVGANHDIAVVTARWMGSR